MPCTDGGVPYPDTRYEKLTKTMPAVVCAMMRQVPDVVRQVMNNQQQDSGVTWAEVEEWFKEHEQLDRERRARNLAWNR